MATATPARPNPAAARDAVVEQAIAAAANKVRLNDLFTGAAAAAVVFLSYLAVMVVLDKLFTLPDWVRLLGLVGLLGGLGAVAYFLVVRPLRRRVNPRYVARQIEATLPDAKNVLINWVDLQDEQLPGSVKAAVGANAAEGVADADVDAATSTRKVMWLGGAAGGLVLVLAILFLVFSAGQFFSLVQRAVVPFTPTPIATRTTITLTEPEGGDATVTDGQSLTIAVTLDGRLPDPNGPDKARLLVRYDPESDEVVEVPLEPAGKSTQFALTLGRGTLLNGLWYRVAAGDARTPEYKVTVRTRPLLGEFNATYKYPAYLKWPDSAEASGNLKAIRGTTVTLTVKANRSVDTATLTAVGSAGKQVAHGEVFGDTRNRLRFTLPLNESGTYSIAFKPKGEAAVSTTSYPVVVEDDFKPVPEITSPKEEEVQLPLNGLLAVDGRVKDDHGIAGVELRFKVVGNDTMAIKPKVFRDGKPLVREQDGTHLTDIPDYKDSVKLDALIGADGKPVTLTDKDVLEYWLAASDNCEPDANVGESARKRVRLTPAVTEKPKQQEQANKEQQRKQEEQKGEQKRDEQLKNEKRPDDQSRDPNPERKPQDQTPDGKDPNQEPKQGDGKQDGKQPDGQPNPEQKGGDNQLTPEEQQKADDLKKRFEEQKEQQKREGGDARGDGDKSEGKETPPSAEQKPQDGKQGGDGQKQAAEQKGGPPREDMGKPESKPGEGKDGGKLTDPQRSEEKPDPKPDAKGNDKPTGEQPKTAPKEGAEAGTSKESKEDPSPKPTNPNEKPDGKQGEKKDGSAGAGRGAEPPPDPNQKPDNTGTQKPDEKKVDPKDLGGSKPKGEPTRGQTKPEPKKGDGGTTDTPKPDEKKDAGGAKGEAPTPKAESKDGPQKGQDGQPMPPKNPPPADAGSEKDAPKQGDGSKDAAAEPKGEGKKGEKPPTPPDGSGKTEDDKGATKPSNTDPPKKGDGGGKPDEKDPKGQPQGGGKGDDKKLDPKEMEQAVKDLESKDPQTKKDAQQKLDKAVGKENREQIEKMQKDLKSDDKATREAAQQKLEEMKKEAEKNAQGGGEQKPKELTEEQKKELTEAAKNLDSKDPQTKKEAQEKLDKAVGKENREAIEKMQQDLKSDDKATREAAQKKLEEMAKEAQKNAQKGEGQKPRELTEAEKKELAEAAKNLKSKDEKTRREAEKKLDEAIGKQNREELQQDMKDLTGDDPQKAEQARERMQKKIDEARKNGDGKHDDRDGKLGGGNSTKPGKTLEADLENQLKAGELTLDDFKKYRGDKKFLKENNWTEAEYERFLKAEEARVQKLRDQLAAERLNPSTEPTGTPTVGRNDFSGDRVKGRTEADKLGGSGGPAVAPPGFAEAQKRFAEEAAKRNKEKK